MKIDKSAGGEFGDFLICESEGREIIQTYIDFETKLIIVMEKYRDLNAWDGYTRELITLNPKNGDIIEKSERKNFINYKEIKGEDKTLNLKWTIKRFDRLNGQEGVKIEIYSLNENNPIETERWSAFSKDPQKSIPDLYEEIIINRKKYRIQKEKARSDYLKKNFKEKVNYWTGNLYQELRMNYEININKVYTKERIEEIKEYDPEIEMVMKEVLENYWKRSWK